MKRKIRIDFEITPTDGVICGECQHRRGTDLSAAPWCHLFDKQQVLVESHCMRLTLCQDAEKYFAKTHGYDEEVRTASVLLHYVLYGN